MSFEELLADVTSLRRAATNAQAQQKAAEAWQQAESLRRNAVATRKNGNLAEAIMVEEMPALGGVPVAAALM